MPTGAATEDFFTMRPRPQSLSQTASPVEWSWIPGSSKGLGIGLMQERL